MAGAAEVGDDVGPRRGDVPEDAATDCRLEGVDDLAQRRWHEVSGVNRTHYCGAYWGYGFHEDGLRSAVRVVSQVPPLLRADKRPLWA